MDGPCAAPESLPAALQTQRLSDHLHRSEGRPTVYDLVQDAGAWLVPVGRLDLDTTGLLIMTNDTDFGERLTNPEYKVPKTYQAKCADLLTDDRSRACAAAWN